MTASPVPSRADAVRAVAEVLRQRRIASRWPEDRADALVAGVDMCRALGSDPRASVSYAVRYWLGGVARLGEHSATVDAICAALDQPATEREVGEDGGDDCVDAGRSGATGLAHDAEQHGRASVARKGAAGSAAATEHAARAAEGSE